MERMTPRPEAARNSPLQRWKSLKPRHAKRGFGRKTMGALALIGLVASSAGALGSITLQADTASATTVGAGMTNSFGGHVGVQGQDGAAGFCLDPSASAPVGMAPVSTEVLSELPAVPGSKTVSGDSVGRINMAVTKYTNGEYGNLGTEDEVAAAVNAVVYEFSSAGTPGSAYLGGSASSALNAYNAILGDVQNNFVAGGTGAGSGSLTFNVDPLNNYAGTVTVHMTSGSTGTITLTNGIFTATGTTTASVTDGTVLSILGTPPDDVATYKISASVAATGTGGYSNSLTVNNYGAGEQRIVFPGPPATTNFSFAGEDPMTRSTLFAPIVGTTVASKFVDVGSNPVDTLTFSTAAFADENGASVTNPWRQRTSGTYLEVVANGTLYGPSTAPFVESDTVPANTPVAGHATVTTSTMEGPTKTYDATSDQPVIEAGYYTWVWSITAADQTAFVQRSLPASYSFTDRFGQVAETHVSPANIQFVTQLDKSQAALGDTVTDTITAAVTGGPWLQADGARIPVTLTGTAYYSESAPAVANTAPAGAKVVGTQSVVVTGPSTPFTADPIPVGNTTGYVTVQWCIDPAAQPVEYQGFVTAWCDQYGVPSETTQVVGPTITTKAQPVSGPGGTVTDTAIVSGPIPVGGIDITFVGYLQPGDSTTAVCGVDQIVYESSDVIHVTEPGEYTSESFPVTDAETGTIYWVETGTFPGTDTVIHRGECGLPNETTKNQKPTVTTKATNAISVGDQAHDVATVNGWILDGTTLVYHFYKFDGTQATCAAANEVFNTADKPQAVTAGLNANTEYASASTPPIIEVGTYGFVEELIAPNGDLLHRGVCGEASETVVVTALPPTPPTTTTLASTGVNGEQDLIGGGLAIAIMILGASALLIRQRSKEKANA